MEILEHGNNRKWQVECKCCRSIIAYKLSDIFKESDLNEYNEQSEFDCVECPVCENKIVIQKSY